jgi:ubiquinone/menaquinone biosynthesis C-methylase UbiE
MKNGIQKIFSEVSGSYELVNVVKPVGYLLSGSREGYAYLSSTIPRFYGPKELADILTESGFYQVTWRPLSFGLVAVHVAVKKARIVAPGQLM